MTYRNQLGAKWLHWMNNKTPHTRIWGERECGLKRLAEKMKDEGVPFDEIISRITELRLITVRGDRPLKSASPFGDRPNLTLKRLPWAAWRLRRRGTWR